MNRSLSPRLAGLFLVALLGTLVMIGLALAPLGWVGLVPYAIVVLVGLGMLARTARQLRRAEAARSAAGRTCTCCTSTVHDPVDVR